MNTCMRTLVVFMAIAALFLVSNSAFGQDSLYIDSSGKVGIGTDTPGYKLDVAGNINTNNFLYINAWPDYGNGYFRIWHDGDGGSGTPAGEQKTVFDVGNKSDVLSLDNDGNVFVNEGNLTTNHYLTIDAWPGYGDGNTRIWHDGDGGSGTAAGKQKVVFHVGDKTNALNIHDDGNVGIGVGEPAERLQVDGNVVPRWNNWNDLGAEGLTWANVYTTNCTGHSSDERRKDNIKDIPLGLDFISELRPISYKWKDINIPEVRETRTVKRQKTRRVTKKVYKEDIKLINGKYVRKWIAKNQEVDEPIFEEHPLYEENGKKVGMHKFPVMETVDIEVIVQEERNKKFTRSHYGFSAQQVKATMDSYGVDFDGIVYDDKNDTYVIRMGEFVPILMKAVQELKTEVDKLEAEISKLKK